MPRTVNVYLSDPQASWVEAEIAAGRAQTASEVLRHAIELARRDRELHEARLDRLRRKIGAGLDELDAGLVSTRSVNEIFDRSLRRGGKKPWSPFERQDRAPEGR